MLFALAIILFSALSYATDPTTTSSGTSNGTTYNFGTWTGSPVYVTLTCVPGGSNCANTSYCTDTTNACDPTNNGTLYSSPVTVSTEGVSYIRYASENSASSWGDTGSSTMEIDTAPPVINITQDAAGTWSNDQTITVSVSDNESGVANTVWAVESSPDCGPSQDSDLNSGTIGTSMQADNDTLYQGKYICFRVTDNVGNTNYASSSQIQYLDTTPPTVSAGPNETVNSQFTQNGMATDSGSGVATYNWVQTSGPGVVNFGSPGSASTSISASEDGTYVISLTATDLAGNVGSSSFTLQWITTPPNITISNPDSSPAQSKTVSASVSSGSIEMAVTSGSTCDSSLTFVPYAPVTFGNESDNGERVCYRVSDSLGNTAYNMSNVVAGIDTTKPVLTLNGDASVSLEVFSNYSDAGATATDKHDGDLTSKITVNNPVNTNKLGTYTITYDVSDAAGNKAVELTRTVDVVDTTKPVITLLGNSTVTIQTGSNYTDAGATAWDNYDGNLTSKIVVGGQVDTNASGVYNITYDVSDSSGNKADEVVRTVTVQSDMTGLIVCGLFIIVVVIIVAACAAAYFLFFKRRHGPHTRQRPHSE